MAVPTRELGRTGLVVSGLGWGMRRSADPPTSRLAGRRISRMAARWRATSWSWAPAAAPATKGLGLDTAGVTLTARGGNAVDEQCRAAPGVGGRGRHRRRLVYPRRHVPLRSPLLIRLTAHAPTSVIPGAYSVCLPLASGMSWSGHGPYRRWPASVPSW